jgi:hypothetical protein
MWECFYGVEPLAGLSAADAAYAARGLAPSPVGEQFCPGDNLVIRNNLWQSMER